MHRQTLVYRLRKVERPPPPGARPCCGWRCGPRTAHGCHWTT
ncbi:hypothetical protein [Streptomyces sp. RTd22]